VPIWQANGNGTAKQIIKCWIVPQPWAIRLPGPGIFMNFHEVSNSEHSVGYRTC
jgi:hypothetical protein